MKEVKRSMQRTGLILEAVVWLTMVWLQSHVLPGKLYRRLLPKPAPSPIENVSRGLPTVAWSANVSLIGSAVRRASDAVPFRSVCFHRGIAAYRMLRRRNLPCTLHYGVARVPGGGALQAHVWVSSDGQDVVGGAANTPFQEIARFCTHSAGDVLPGVAE